MYSSRTVFVTNEDYEKLLKQLAVYGIQVCNKVDVLDLTIVAEDWGQDK